MSTYSKELYQIFADYVFRHAGIHYSAENFYQLDSRLRELSHLLGIENPEELLRVFRMGVDPKTHEYVIELATNNETSFFRDVKPFEMLVNEIFPNLIKANKDTKKISIWSAASSTGQEPYSILMTWYENFPQYKDWSVDLLGSDISEKVITKSQIGKYSQLEVQRGLPIKLLMKYFKQIEGGQWQINDQLLSHAKFKKMNLLQGGFGYNTYDVVFCRNVLIYQPLANKEKILNEIYKSLKPGGYLVMGAGESLLGIKSEFEKQLFKDASAFVKPDPNTMKKVA